MGNKELLTVCMGSACHQKGVFRVLNRLQAFVVENNLQEVVEIKGAFCMGDCNQGIVMDINGQRIHNVKEDNIQLLFEQVILPDARSRERLK